MRLGIDLGGSKIEIVALGDGSTELLRRRVPTPRGDYQGTLAAIAGLVQQAERELGRRGSLGVGIPGAESRVTGLIKKVSANRTILMVEHNMNVVAGISDTITVLARGGVIAEGPYAQVSQDAQVREAYMGTSDSELAGAH